MGADFEHYRICEFDKYAVQSYNAVHGTEFETSDITKITADDLGIVDTDKYCYVMTYSFPCTDLSQAGKMLGMAKGSGTRSGLLWEVERLLDECKELPQVLLMENVPAVIGAKNIQHFAKWQEKLESLGYKNKWEVLNAKDYGIPQNRERCFMVSILGDYFYDFPKKIPLKLRLKDMLEKEVDEKYYLSKIAENLIFNSDYASTKAENKFPVDGIAHTILTNSNFTGAVVNLVKEKVNQKLEQVAEPIAYDEQNQYLRQDGCVGTLTTDGSSPKHNNRIVEPVSTRGSDIAGTIRATIHKQGARNLLENVKNGLGYEGVIEPIVWDGYNQRVRADSETVGTLTQNCGADLKRNGQGIIEPIGKYELSEKMKRYINSYDDSYKVSDGNLVVNRDIAVAKTTREGSTRADASDYISAELEQNKNIAKLDCTAYRIRKLTPKETWRLMGFSDTDIDNAIAVGMSNAQLYKQAGNSIVVNVLMAIFKEML